MTSRIVQWTLDVQDMERMATFWSRALGYRVEDVEDGKDGDDGVHLRGPGAGHLSVYLQRTADGKREKNRSHPDLVAVDGDVDAEVRRLLALGARRVDVGQDGSESFEVLADPEGNEFSVLHPATRG